MSIKILVKYNGVRIPFFGKQAIKPGVQEVDAALFDAHIKTPIGQVELKTNIWEYVADEADKKADNKEPGFLGLPVVKQKEQVGEIFDIEYLKDLRDAPKLNQGVKKDILARIEELEADIKKKSEAKK